MCYSRRYEQYNMEICTITNEKIEECADYIKIVVLASLVKDNLFLEKANRQFKNVTIIRKRKNFFRTLSSLCRENEEKDMNCFICKYVCKEKNSYFCCYGAGKIEIPTWLVKRGYPYWCPYIKAIKINEKN